MGLKGREHILVGGLVINQVFVETSQDDDRFAGPGIAAREDIIIEIEVDSLRSHLEAGFNAKVRQGFIGELTDEIILLCGVEVLGIEGMRNDFARRIFDNESLAP